MNKAAATSIIVILTLLVIGFHAGITLYTTSQITAVTLDGKLRLSGIANTYFINDKTYVVVTLQRNNNHYYLNAKNVTVGDKTYKIDYYSNTAMIWFEKLPKTITIDGNTYAVKTHGIPNKENLANFTLIAFSIMIMMAAFGAAMSGDKETFEKIIFLLFLFIPLPGYFVYEIGSPMITEAFYFILFVSMLALAFITLGEIFYETCVMKDDSKYALAVITFIVVLLVFGISYSFHTNYIIIGNAAFEENGYKVIQNDSGIYTVYTIYSVGYPVHSNKVYTKKCITFKTYTGMKPIEMKALGITMYEIKPKNSEITKWQKSLYDTNFLLVFTFLSLIFVSIVILKVPENDEHRNT